MATHAALTGDGLATAQRLLRLEGRRADTAEQRVAKLEEAVAAMATELVAVRSEAKRLSGAAAALTRDDPALAADRLAELEQRLAALQRDARQAAAERRGYHAYLGVDVAEGGVGVRVEGTSGPAAAAGVLPGDELRHATVTAPYTIRTADDYARCVRELPRGAEVTLLLQRGGSDVAVTLTPAVGDV